jgi:hypothetical protein
MQKEKCMKTLGLYLTASLALLSTFGPQPRCFAQGTAFTYQGRLNDNGQAANGSFDLRFSVYDGGSNGNLVAGPITNSATPVASGLFSVSLDFGVGVFTGPARWLEIGVRTNGNGAFVELSSRQPVTAAPYAVLAADVAGANIARLNQPNSSRQATANAVLTGAFVTGYIITDGGAGYTSDPAVTLTGGGGSGATASAQIDPNSGVVTNIMPGSAGSGYTSPPTVTLGGPPQINTQLFVTPDVFAGPVTMSNRNNQFVGDFTGNGAGLTNLNAWQTTGNAGTQPNLNFLGTTDNQPLQVRVNGMAAIEFIPPLSGQFTTPNIIAGIAAYKPPVVRSNVIGAVIAGGGSPTTPWSGFGAGDYMAVFDNDCFIGGGFGNKAGTDNGDPTDASLGTIGGGVFNATTNYAATVAGGQGNLAGGAYSAVPGGVNNIAAGAYSFAAGNGAQALHPGSFVWSDDSTSVPFASTGSNQFLIRAGGGVGIDTTAPTATLSVNGTANKPGGGSWSIFSDFRLKKNIEPLTGALSRLLQLRAVTFEYKDPEAIHELPGSQIGMIAQEVEKVFPDWVDTAANGMKRLNIHGFEALTVQALRELREEQAAKILELERTNQTLQLQVAELRGQLATQNNGQRETTSRLAALERSVAALEGNSVTPAINHAHLRDN